jgi:UDP-N-acetylglucosamine 2-epimerase (non-hydrolysing)
MSDVFFHQLGLPQPAYFLGIESGTPTQQTAEIMLRFEPILAQERPDWLVVVGDVTSTLACALVATRLGIRVVHVEAGLRAGDRQMPEEINRILTDHLADLLLVTEQAGLANLRREGVPDANVRFVGNLMIDSLVYHRRAATALDTVGKLGLRPKNYMLLTMHRPANVDTEAGLTRIIEIVSALSKRQTIVFPLHPRTRTSLIQHQLLETLASTPAIRLLEPQGYLEFLNLLEHAAIILTDSGGVQEEATYLNVPCLTLRSTTERPVTIELGTNRLVPELTTDCVVQAVDIAIAGRARPSQPIPLWDGSTAGRILDCLRKHPAVE